MVARSLSATVYYAGGNARSRIIAAAMFAGIKAFGSPVTIKPSAQFKGVESDLAVFYGLSEGLSDVLEAYRERARGAIFIDLGYWGRRKKTRWDGYHKVVLNARHPTAYFQRITHSADRFRELGQRIRPWRKAGTKIIVAGMSAKAAAADGFAAEAWERKTIQQLRKLTKRPIIYRPKPNWYGARPIAGAAFDRTATLDEAFSDCHAVVTHHSNVAIDALLGGIPVFCWDGVALPMALQDLTRIEDPWRPEGREQWAADIAWTQFTADEMRAGLAWRHILKEVLC